MLYVENDGSIRLTRGDTARLVVSIFNESADADYIITENDTLTLSVKKKAKDAVTLILKQVIGSNVFHIQPTDTSKLPFGRYLYDVQLTTMSGDVYTVITPKTFELMQEVTW